MKSNPDYNKSLGYQIEALTTLDELEEIRSTWDELVNQLHTDSPSLTYGWLTTWWQCMKDDNKELIVLVIKKSGVTIGIAPFMLVKDRFLFLKIRKLEFLSMSRYADSPSNIAVTLDLIIPNNNSEITKAIFQFLKNNYKWHFIRLNPVSSDSPAIENFKVAALESGYHYNASVVFDHVILQITGSWQNYMKSLSKNFRKHLSGTEKKLKEKGLIAIELYTGKEELRLHMTTILDIEKRSWKWNIGVSINSIIFGNFFSRLIDLCADTGMIQLWLQRVGDKYIAYDYNILFHNSIVSLKGSYDSDYQSYSPGNILLAKEIEHAFEQKYDSINMLWGMTTTKQRWLPSTKPYYEIFIFNKQWFSQILFTLFIKMNLIPVERIVREYRNRLFRKLNIRLKNSELTRMDQLDEMKGK
jgi:CelD/BcsL family acetyltransferase involved in cellulose biosynthesis